MPRYFKLFFIGIAFLVLPVFVRADIWGDSNEFFIEPMYDGSTRNSITATLRKVSSKTYFYIDNEFWNSLNYDSQQQVVDSLNTLSLEFENRIYPTLTSNFGLEWRPGIDRDYRITVLVHSMDTGVGGYFRTSDEYSKYQIANSNEREMVYLNADYIINPIAKSYLAHEFTHLITFNQKDKRYNVSEETWLNEARAEYAPTLLGYDDDFEGSNLENRVGIFLNNPSDSITEWRNEKADYGALRLFIQYLVEQYGIEVLNDSLKSKKTGIESLNYALEKNGFEQDFSQIFTDWLITVVVNDCSIGEGYCYQNKNLENLQLTPLVNFLPLKGQSSLGVGQTAKNWSGQWQKFVGGKQGALKIEFIGNPDNVFRIPYLLRDFSGQYFLDYFPLDENQRGDVLISGFGTEISSVVIIPSVQTKMSGFSNKEEEVPFFWEVSTITEKEKLEQEAALGDSNQPISEMSREEILAKISEIEQLLSQLRAQLAETEEESVVSFSCSRITQDLRFGMQNGQTSCLQEFLKAQGPEIYPEGLVTGYFGPLTKKAVIRFQEKYKENILSFWGLTEGTGFVGEKTRAKINELLS